MFSLMLLFAALGSSLPEVPSVDNVTVTQQLVHYPVSGRNARELGQALDASGLGDRAAGRRTSAYAAVSIDWRYHTRAHPDGSCELDGYEIDLHVRIDMPDWRLAEGVSANLRARWKAFYARLLAHELGHRDIAVQSAIAMRDVLAAIPDMPCADVEAWVRPRTNALFRGLERAQRAYDRETDHGLTQGAAWP